MPIPIIGTWDSKTEKVDLDFTLYCWVYKEPVPTKEALARWEQIGEYNRAAGKASRERKKERSRA